VSHFTFVCGHLSLNNFIIEKVVALFSKYVLIFRGVEKTTQKGALCSVHFIKYYTRDQPKKTSWQGMWHLQGRGEVHTEFWWGNLRNKGHLKTQK
jgi:hypothetical protein